MTDVWAHRFRNNPKLLEEIEDDDFDPDDIPDLVPVPDADAVNDFEEVK